MTKPLICKSGDRINGGEYSSIVAVGCKDVVLEGVTVTQVLEAGAGSATSAIRVEDCDGVVMHKLLVTGGLAVAGKPAVAEDANPATGPEAVVGRPLGYGVKVYNCKNVDLTESEVVGFERQLAWSEIKNGLIAGNWLHGRRRTGIVGGAWDGVSVLNNLIEDARPWQRPAPVGDHSDHIALWSSKTLGGKNVRIEGNVFRQMQDGSTLGVWIQGRPDDAGIWTDVKFNNNYLELANTAGFQVWGIAGGEVIGNHMVTVQAAGIEVLKQRPSIQLLDNVSGVTVTRNRVSGPLTDRTGKNTLVGNTILTGAIMPAGSVQSDPAEKVRTALLAAKLADIQAILSR